MNNPDPLMTLQEVADYLGGVSVRFVRREIAAEHMEGTFLGRLVRVRRSAVERYLADVSTQPGGDA